MLCQKIGCPTIGYDGFIIFLLINLCYCASTLTVSLCATWATPFDPSRTTKQPFHRTSMMTGTCEMMVTDASFRYIAAESYEIIQLPYRSNGSVKGSSSSKVIVDIRYLTYSLFSMTLSHVYNSMKSRVIFFRIT